MKRCLKLLVWSVNYNGNPFQKNTYRRLHEGDRPCERSCQRYLAITKSMDVLDPLRIRYREALIQVVQAIVRGIKAPSDQKIMQLAEELVPGHDRENLGAVFFADDGTPTRYPNFTSAQIIDSGLIMQPANVTLVTVNGSKFPAGVYHAFDYSLFYENIRVNIAERIKAFHD